MKGGCIEGWEGFSMVCFEDKRGVGGGLGQGRAI